MSNSRNIAVGQIRPTLFIGLGGTGKEVLLRLRRKFYEKFGKPSLPCASFLWIDTDLGDKDATGVELDAVYKSVQFQDAEKFALLNGQVGSDVAAVFRNPEQWPHIHDWLYPEVARYGTGINDFAGGVRALGRLTFFKRFAGTEGLAFRVRAALDDLLSPESIQESLRISSDIGLGTVEFTNEMHVQIVLICSIAGGTGGGTMLDTAFYLRHLSQQHRIPIDSLHGVAFLPNVYFADAAGEQAQRSFGNAYATLKELEYYSMVRGEDSSNESFLVEWEKGLPLEIQGPPFSAVYLQEMCNEAGVTLRQENRQELFTSVAESLFLDFMPGAFSTQKRSQYCNIVAHLCSVRDAVAQYEGVPLPQHFARRYASCGLSKIEVPLDAILGACSTQLASEMLAYVLRENDNADVRRDVADELAAGSIDEAGIQNLFGNSWKQTIQNEVGDMYRGRSAGKLQDIENLEAVFWTLETKLVQADPTETGETGLAVGLIRESAMRAVGMAEAWLTKWVQDSLDNCSRGLKSLVKPTGYLPYAKSIVESLYKDSQADEKPRLELLKEQATAEAVFLSDAGRHTFRNLGLPRTALGLPHLECDVGPPNFSLGS